MPNIPFYQHAPSIPHLTYQGQHPTPDVEIAFWKQRAAALNSIHDQLQSPRVRKARVHMCICVVLCGMYRRVPDQACITQFIRQMRATDVIAHITQSSSS